MANRPIPIDEANAMIQQYSSYMKGLGVDMAKQTHSVSFTAPEFLSWLDEVKPYTDEFRIFMGDYPSGKPDAGRTTVIIWPYKDGQPATKPEGKDGGGNGIPTYNQGGMHP